MYIWMVEKCLKMGDSCFDFLSYRVPMLPSINPIA